MMEHHSNIVPWHFLRERKGAVLKWAPIRDDGEFLLDEFEQLLDRAHQDGRGHPHVERARHHRSDQGGRPPSRTRAACRCWSTAARAPCTCRVDVQDLDCDFYVFTGHKLYGPTGIGVLYGKKRVSRAMPPFLGGGDMISVVDADHITYADAAAQVRGRHAAHRRGDRARRRARLHERVGHDRIAAHEAALRAYAQERLERARTGSGSTARAGQGRDRLLQLDGLHPHDVSTIVDRRAWRSAPATTAPSR